MRYVPDKFLSIVLLTIPQASDKLPTQHRPQEVGWWFRIGRRLYGRKNIPVISSIDEFEARWIQWWSAAQPKGRDVGRWPFSQGEITGDWGKLLSGGKDGLFLIVMSLGWWAHAWDPMVNSKLDAAISDVSWVTKELITSLSMHTIACSTSPEPPAIPSQLKRQSTTSGLAESRTHTRR